MNGWFKQQRNLPDRPWFKEAVLVQVYIALKSMAYVADGMYEGVRICRGSCPTTQSDMIETTGLSRATLIRCLNKLVSFGEIILKTNNRFTVVTICNYDICGAQDSLFPTTDDTSNDTTRDTSNDTTRDTSHLSTIEYKEYKKEDNLISLESYKKERESLDVAYKMKEKYNRTFDGKLPPCIRLTVPTKMMVLECVRRFGLQTVDPVFEQVLSEPFSLGANNTGFQANFQFIFNPKNFQGYLERAQLRRQKKHEPQPKTSVQPQQQVANGSWLDAYNENSNWKPKVK